MAKQSRSWLLLLAVLLPAAYVLSYAPVVKLKGGMITRSLAGISGTSIVTAKVPICGMTTLSFYRPVDWLIDNTPLREPLMAWADVWGVRDVFGEAVMWR